MPTQVLLLLWLANAVHAALRRPLPVPHERAESLTIHEHGQHRELREIQVVNREVLEFECFF